MGWLVVHGTSGNGRRSACYREHVTCPAHRCIHGALGSGSAGGGLPRRWHALWIVASSWSGIVSLEARQRDCNGTAEHYHLAVSGAMATVEKSFPYALGFD